MIILAWLAIFVLLALGSSQHEQTYSLVLNVMCVSWVLHAKVTVGRFLIYMYDVPSRVLCLVSSMWSSVIWSVGPQRIDWLRW